MKKNGTIILIDDNEEELKLAEIAMNKVKMEHEVVSFSASTKAFDYIVNKAQDIFVVISDFHMPHMSGLQLLEKINSSRELKMKALPFIFLSNTSYLEDIENAYLSSAHGFFIKPMKLDLLEEIFKDIVIYWDNAKTPRD